MRKFILLGVFALLAPNPLIGCNVPVFRYALERWPVDPYVVVAVEVTPFSTAEKVAVEKFRAQIRAGLNAQLQTMKSKAFSESAYSRQVSGRVTANQLFLFYPKASGFTQPPWNGPVSKESVMQLAGCKNRKALVTHLLNGSSGVFLLLESGDRKEDEKARQLLNLRLKELSKTIKLPAKVATAEEKKDVDPIDQLKSNVPFKIEFTLHVIPKVDTKANGSVLRQSLLGLEPDLFDMQDKPMVFLAYGRGRVLPPLIGNGINNRMIDQLATFVTGACSCQIKSQNPGTDLLLKQDWDKAVLGKGGK